MIPFNKPYLTGSELTYIRNATRLGKISGNGYYTNKCHELLSKRYGFQKCLLTTSCTDALEMCALLVNIAPGDEVIMPSYTFVSTANAFVLRGARIVFCDSKSDHPGINEDQIESLITERTKALVVVHYAGVATDMNRIMKIAGKHKLLVIEDAAQAIDGYYTREKRRPLGGIGHLAAFSFHETKNIISGEGGVLVINDPVFNDRAEVLWEKGTNRSRFFRGEIDRYTWTDVGSSFLMSEINAAFLYAQLKSIDKIQKRRKKLWDLYWGNLEQAESTGFVKRPRTPEYSTNNAHMFYLVCQSKEIRDRLIANLLQNNILAIVHYVSLHNSEYYSVRNTNTRLEEAERYTDCLLRLPLFYELRKKDIFRICRIITDYFSSHEALTVRSNLERQDITLAGFP